MWNVGVVRYLNSVPLVDGLDEAPGVRLVREVPSRLLPPLEARRLDLALCPVVDYQRSSAPLVIVPAGGIGCQGTTLTVRLFARVPPSRVRTVAVDGDSHTSVALLQVLYDLRFGRRLDLSTLEDGPDRTDAVLLIGDKVVTSAPARDRFEHGFDLGEWWLEQTGRPFVFAAWMTHRDRDLGVLPVLLDRTRIRNAGRVDELADREGPRRGWPSRLAATYLGRLLRYHVGPAELESIQLFWRHCHRLGLVDNLRPLELYHPPRSARLPDAAGG